MTSLLKPFTGFVPSSDYAPRIVGPASSMLTPEQRKLLSEDDLSFRSVVGRGARAHHTEAMNWLHRCLDLDALQPVQSSAIVHRLTRGSYSATGLLADVSVDAYDAGRIKRHETTIAKTERKMLDYMQSTRVYGNPVALAHHDNDAHAQALRAHTQRPADVGFETIDSTCHELWIVAGDDAVDLCENLDEALYITDGHHRLAGASSLAEAEDLRDSHLPAALYAESELLLWTYARALSDDSIVAADTVEALADRFVLEETADHIPRPTSAHQIGVRLDQRSFMLTIPETLVPTAIHDQLDVNLLQDLVLEPLFGVTDPRTDSRLQFIADTGDEAHDPDAFEAWFLPHPTRVSDVMTVADAGQTMPPKSTFFMPKVPSGLVIRPVDVS